MRAREADLSAPVKAWLSARGFEVKGEVGSADLVGRHPDGRLAVVELKRGFSLALFHQGIARQAVTDLVYLAVPRPDRRAARDNVGLARRLGLGVLFVGAAGRVECGAEPGPYRPRKSAAKTARLTRAFDRLRGDPNDGGATRHGLVTGYRQEALACARFLAVHGPSKGAVVARLAEVPQATRIMADNHYGWFVRAARGVYALTDAGRSGLADWGEED